MPAGMCPNNTTTLECAQQCNIESQEQLLKPRFQAWVVRSMSAVQVYASFEPKAQPHKRATRSDMLQALGDQKDGKDLVILDARGHHQYTGQVSATCDVAKIGSAT